MVWPESSFVAGSPNQLRRLLVRQPLPAARSFNMTFRLLLCGTLLTASLPTLAQQGRPVATRPASRPAAVTAQPAAPNDATIQARADALTTGMTQGLGLTPAQTEKVRAINLQSVRNVETARLLYRQEPTKLRNYIDDISNSRLDRLKDVLSPVQFQRYQQKREQKMGIPQPGGVQGNPPPGLGGE